MLIRSAAILAGGASSRMGRDKALLLVEGETLIARTAALLRPLFPQLVTITSRPEIATAAGLPAIPDTYPNRGPLGGIHAALNHFQEPVFVVACDMPFLVPDFIAHMLSIYQGQDALVPEGENGPEHLHAIYAPACLPKINRYLEQPKPPSLRRVLESCEVAFVEIAAARRFSPNLRCFENWNAPEDIRDTASS